MSKMVTKNGFAIQSLAAQFMLLEPGMRIPRVEDLAKNLGTGRGTIQTALKFLCEKKAVVLESHGHQGTFLIASDRPRLWDSAGFFSVLGVMPLPYSKCYEGLATALRAEFEKAEIPFILAYQRGSSTRAYGLKMGRFDFAVCSKLAANYITRSDEELSIAILLGQHSYVESHALILRDGLGDAVTDGMRVALDSSSYDQVLLTNTLIQDKDVAIVECAYNQIPEMLNSRMVDAAVWNSDNFHEDASSLRCRIVPIVCAEFIDSTEAAILYRRNDRFLNMFINKIIDPAKVSRIQEEVKYGARIPKF